jgi:hypothetical protein
VTGKYTALFPEFFAKSPIMKPRPAWFGRLLAEQRSGRPDLLERFGLPFLLELQRHNPRSTWTAEQLRVLHQIFQSSRVTSRWALRTALYLSDSRTAKAILRNSDAKSPTFLANRLKLALFAVSGFPSAVETAVTDLTEADMLDDAIDVLLITGNWATAIGKQFEGRDFAGALVNARARPANDEKRGVLRELAEQLAEAGMFVPAMQLLADSGDTTPIAEAFEKAGEIEQAAIIPSLMPHRRR